MRGGQTYFGFIVKPYVQLVGYSGRQSQPSSQERYAVGTAQALHRNFPSLSWGFSQIGSKRGFEGYRKGHERGCWSG